MTNRLKYISFIVLVELLVNGFSNGAEVTSISPSAGSLNGGTRLTIHGSGFAESQFNYGQGNENLGSYVELVSGTLKYVCDKHTDGCTATMVTCYTRPMPEGEYSVRVKVDGVPIAEANHCSHDPSKCVFKARWWNTPSITRIEPTSGEPGSFVTLYGRIITTRFGSNLVTGSGIASQDNKLLRVYVNSVTCEVKDTTTDTFYGLALDDPTSNMGYGHIKCKMGGSYVGIQNFSFIVENEYGRSKPDIKLLTTDSNSGIGMYRTYAVIRSVSPTVGSTNGGAILTLTGKYFDATDKEITVQVGGQDCKVENFTAAEIKCTTPPEPSGQPSYAGNRGLLKEEWTSTSETFANRANILSLASSAGDYQSVVLDNSSFVKNATGVSRLSGYFVPSMTAGYRFQIMADDFAALYFSQTTGLPADQVEIATCASKATNYYTHNGQVSRLFDLVKGNSYYMTVLQGNAQDTSSVKVAARTYLSPVTNGMSGTGLNDKQELLVNSTVVNEKQSLTLSGLDAASTVFTGEVQTVTVSEITGSNVDATYRLGLYGVYTAPLSAKATDKDIQLALNNLATLAPDTVTIVQTSPSATSEQFKITFNSDRGNLPELTYKIEPASSTLSISVAQTTAGTAGKSKAYIEIDGVISPGIKADASATDVKTALDQMFGVRCPPVIASPEDGAADYLQDFEGAGSAFGEISSEESFCGRFSVKNPSYIYKTPDKTLGVKLGQYKTLCFGYKGEINQLKIIHDYKGATRRFTDYISLDLEPSLNQWNYTCTDIGTPLVNKNPTESIHRVWRIEVVSQKTDQDFYIDTVALLIPEKASADTGEGVNLQRYRAAKPGGEAIKDFTVTGSGPYEITMSPYNCGNNFDLFKVTSSQTTVSASTSQISKASPPVTGSFDVTFDGQSVNVPVTTTDKALQTLMETTFVKSIGKVDIVHQGDCANFAYTVTFLTNKGDQPEFTVNGGRLSGETPTASVRTVVNGGALFDPIPGDMLRMANTKPQVAAMINGYPTKCTGTCDFEWSSSSTPTITTASQTQGTQALGTTLDITGTGFSNTVSENSVTIGGVECAVTASTSTSLTCSVGNGPMGQFDIIVRVEGKGQASGSLKFTYTAEITGINPTSGSLGGGTLLTVSGSGFASDAVVQVGGSACVVKDSQPGQITCMTPKTASAATVDVTVQQAGNTLTSPTQYSFQSAKTPTMSSLSISQASVFGGETLTITGSGFGASATSADALKINGATAAITSYSDTSVVATLPSNPPGTYDVQLSVGSYGFADAGSSNQITYRLKVKDIYPTQGSLYGGTEVTVFGEGFGTNKTRVSVSFGSLGCDIKTITDSQITCLTSSTAKTVTITNQGTHQTYGQGFAWDPVSASAQVGDTLQWQWSAPTTGYTFAVEQTDNITATVTKNNGFSSGPSTASGSYMYQPISADTITYWSGYVDVAQSISLAGKVTVTDRPDAIYSLMLKAGGYEAVYDVSSKGSMTPSNSGSCVWDVTPISSCSSLTGDPAKFSFSYQSCSTGTVKSISSNQAASTETIDLIGQGFSTKECQNEVTLGSYRCVVSSSTSGKATCSVDAQGTMQIGDLEYYQVRTSNRGNMFIALPTKTEKSFFLLPHISSISPEKGSLGGGITLTLSGGGFIPLATKVKVGLFDCPVLTTDYSSITCTLPMSSKQENKKITVSVIKNGQTVEAKCSSSNGVCSYFYEQSSTPTVTQVTPDTISGQTTLTITGTLFGTDQSAVTVLIGGAPCTVSAVSDTTITCNIAAAPVGQQDVTVLIGTAGKASTAIQVNGADTLTSVNPASGSTEGNTAITIQGNGFVDGKTTVQINGNECKIISTTLAAVTCSTPAGTGTQSISVVSNGVTYSTILSYTYDSASTPTVTNIAPTSGKAGDTLTITGTSFSSVQSNDVITIGNATCTVTSATSTSIQCTLGDAAPGQYDVLVDVQSLGRASTASKFTYTVSASSINPGTGSLGGGQRVTITGTGFGPSSTKATICGEDCVVDATASSATQLFCKTPPSTGTVTATCDVVVSDNGQTSTLSGAYQYDANISPSITTVSPSFGGTSGGTTVTITGTGFGTDQSAVTVEMGGVACAIQTIADTEVVCLTGARAGSIDTKVELQVSGGGNARQVGADFSYMYAWSSTNSWGGNNPPAEGEIVVIPTGMTILLDQNTPKLKMLVIQGGKVIFDEKDIELKSEYILITDGGTLQVGTEDRPFQSNAIISLFGAFRSQELPVYGSKVLAVRNGTLDLHGIETPVTWTLLASTVNVGATTATLQTPVNWKVGDSVVFASTGHRHTQSESETRTITAISADGLTLSLDSALKYKHVAESETFGTQTVELRGEVGLLTHNVKVRGSSDGQWNDKIEKCEAGFDTGEFVTQTCFQGRFGDETGSDQFGAHILIHPPRPNEDIAVARLSYIEVTHAGQAFRLGRYPVHFHINGVVTKSYVRGLAIHHTFNRAVNVHGTHNLVIEHTVIYNIMGGAFFLEDGVETGNTFQYNLAVFVIASTSLLNDDITPASFWVTNPNNTIQHNHAAGGTHFGFWYRMHEHPDGPSFDPSICPRNVPLGVFNNNTAHSFGWFGIWIFHDYTPREDGSCSATSAFKVAVFQGLTAWNCEKGAEGVNIGAVQFDGLVAVNNEKAGYEGKIVYETPQYDVTNGQAIKNSLIVGRSQYLDKQPGWTSGSGCTVGGIVIPYGNGLIIDGIKFFNFDQPSCQAFTFTKIDGTCTKYCGAFTYKMQNLIFDSSAPNKVRFDWPHEAVIIDVDGSLTGLAAGTCVLPAMAHLPSSCIAASAGFNMDVAATTCPSSVTFHRMSFNNPLPNSLIGKNAFIETRFGKNVAAYAFKRITHSEGWAAILVGGEKHKLTFDNADHVTNISYSAMFYEFNNQDDFVEVCQSIEQQPDRFFFDSSPTGVNMSTAALDIANNKNGDWYFENSTSDLCYMVAGKLMKKRGSPKPKVNSVDRKIEMNAYKCFFTDCTPPPDPDKNPPVCTRPAQTSTWSDTAIWDVDSDGYVSNVGTGTSGLPQAGQKVKIMKDTWVIGDSTIPQLESLVLEGVLELDHGPSQDRAFTIDVMYLYIQGGRLIIGCEESSPFLGTASIILRGDHTTPVWPRTEGPNIGAKAIGVFGGLDLHGRDVGVAWTRIVQSVAAGSNQIVLTTAVDWVAGDEIIITATGYQAKETEIKTIQSIAGDKKTITLTSNLAYKHIASAESLSNGKSYSIAAEVGKLTRNIKIIGESYSTIDQESFGARVVVGVTADINRAYTGYARISNVEFKNTGQEGFTAPYDPRYSISFLDIGTVSGNAIKPCYVKKSSFHHGYSTAIGAFGTHGLEIQDNIIHRTVGAAVETRSISTRLRRNLITVSYWRGSYNGRKEPDNRSYFGSVSAVATSELVMQGNAISASERAGYHGPPEDCTSSAEPWEDNVIHSSLTGAGVYPTDLDDSGFNKNVRCLQYANFTIWKCYDFGIYYNNKFDVEFKQNTFVDNGVSVFPKTFGPAALDHAFEDRVFKISDSLIVGQSPSFDCATDVIDNSETNIQISSSQRKRGYRVENKGKVGISSGQFDSGSNMATDKPFVGCMAYPAIGGRTEIKGITFANFQSTCGKDVALTNNPDADDLQHPVLISNIVKINVGSVNDFYMFRPRLQVINPSDCVDMDCDGMKKFLIKDSDGSFLGAVGDAIADSAFEWNGDPRRGLGDYRIPKQMLTYPDGTRIPNDVFAKNKGILRDSSCTYKTYANAWVCSNYNYEMMIIENMDPDTETRRLSPVGVLGWDDSDNGYIDLINGPQDHGWCSGYTCQKRISTFSPLVATGRNFSVYFTSTSPQHLRYRLLNSDNTKSVGIATYFNNPHRLDVYCNDNYVLPKNGQYDADKNVQLTAPTTWDQYIPDPATGACGDNYFDNDWKHQHIILRGNGVVDIKVTAVISMGFNVPTLSIDQFFGPNLVNNLALFLNVPASKIRVMNIKSGVSRRKRRSTGSNTLITIEVGNPPCTDINCTTTTGSQLTFTQLQELTVKVVNTYQSGNLSDILNITINTLTVTEPTPPVTDPEWTKVVQSGDQVATELKIPKNLNIQEQPTPSSEGNPFKVQPKLDMLDILGKKIDSLGASTSPWKASVRLLAGSNSLAELTGTTNISFTSGWANFTDLGISHEGSGYVLEFTISYPDVVFVVQSAALIIPQRSLKAGLVSKSGDVHQNRGMSIALKIKDGTTDADVSDINWKGHLWKVTASMSSPTSFGFDGSLAGTNVKTFDPSTGQASFDDLRFDSPGMAVVKFTVTSDPPGYQFEYTEFVEIVTEEYDQVVEDTTKEIQFKVDKDFATYGTQEFGAAVINGLTKNNAYVRAKDLKLSEGSVVITTTVSGNTTTVQTLIDDACDSISNGATFTYNGQTFTLSSYMMINNQAYYGKECGESSDDKMKIGLIVGLIMCVLVIIALTAGIIYWRCVVHPKTKTHKMEKDPRYIGRTYANPEDYLWRENTFNSLRQSSWLPEKVQPPVTTTFQSKNNQAFTGHV